MRYSEEGSSKRPAELQAWVHFCDFLDACEGVSLSQLFILSVYFFFIEGKTDCSIEDVLVFVTGSDRVPPLGFGRKLKVVFLHTGKFCTSSTCYLQLHLPIMISHGESYDAFQKAMVMSLKDNDGFGGVRMQNFLAVSGISRIS